MSDTESEHFYAQLDLLSAADLRRPDGGQATSSHRQHGAGSARFTSLTDEWPTPQGFFDSVNAEFGPLELDPCSTHENHKCPRYFTRAENGLAQVWAPSRVWMNPPYGRELSDWMRKAWVESQRGAFVVSLVPARTDTAWWHDYAMRGTVRFIRGRLKFGGHVHCAPFPSALVIFAAQSASARAQPSDSP